jgi:hypothetical protein
MARDDDADRVAAIGQPDSARNPRTAQLGRQGAIGRRRAVRDGEQQPPDAPLEVRAARRQRDAELGQLATKVRLQLAHHRTKGAIIAAPVGVRQLSLRAAREVQTGQRLAISSQQQLAHRAVIDRVADDWSIEHRHVSRIAPAPSPPGASKALRAGATRIPMQG